MTIEKTPLEGCFLIKPKVFKDNRGLFFESYNQQVFQGKVGFAPNFVQDNQALSKYGSVRGLHLQKGEFAQAKLVRAIQGEILDVVVDVRPGSTTFGQVYCVVLSGENNYQLYIPRGFAHGYSTLSEKAIFAYKCDNFYAKHAESGIIYNDTTLAIDWGIPAAEMIISDKDKILPTFEAFKTTL
ncbi:dTDP-4-dehydrorhamnose 3,5-epimerase [Mesonia hippocampi]|uniref:dTDP-4-dehydrorhamnose 3,5-epimerase n=1 Tax=Mesonia hippocampi TaxID=1628250 RepID=A0A840EMX3_9FLAO|nr:dTDP-4-dehydrorhamnose 3,5-epimerase [Mesonia hippocampi]MBB4118421.1 dTDP-4-dehydrorhamnose 3,5-epimerase [Mesonia hippocampi]